MAQIYDHRRVSPLCEQPQTYEPDSLPPGQSHPSYPIKPPGSPSRQERWHLSERSRSQRLNHVESFHQPFAAQVPRAMYQSRPDLVQSSSREQLPSLSSLFGSTTSHTPESPFLESPLESRHTATAIHGERPYDASYFHRPFTPRYPSYNHAPAPEQLERSGFQPPPRPAQTAMRPVSPHYEPRCGPVELSRIHPSSSGSPWSPQSQATHSEYPSRDTSSSFRPFSEEVRPHPPPAHRPETGMNKAYVDGPHNAPITPNYPPTPASTVAGEAVTKETLGPKIWTGTQFLPRFVRQLEVPGEGMCYFYDDGTHCKTVIDGEVVNAHWGVTKAGKPRKRLAIACITCREKKIKCDPDFPRCVQCEKFGRLCKFKNAPRGGQGSPETPPTEPEENLQRPLSSRTDGEPFKLEKSEPLNAGSPQEKHRPATPDSESNPAKRQRNGFTIFTPVASDASPLAPLNGGPFPWREPLNNRADNHKLLREWQVNPLSIHPGVVTDLVNEFFKRLPETLYRMFPEGVFKLWALSAGEKSLDDLMLIYSILTVGTIFSPKAEHKPLGAHYASLARYACENRKFCIQLVQARILLSIYYYAINNKNDAWDFFGAAIRAASGLKLNLEMDKTDEANLPTYPYGLSRNGYAECRRRTFWYCFLLDRYNSFCSGRVSAVNQEDVFLRLPSDTESFESQASVVNPFFDPTTTPIESMSTKLGSLAYTICISTIWGEIVANIYRASQRPHSPGPNNKSIAFYERITQRLREWQDTLPARYCFSTVNVERAAALGKTGAFLRMHTVFHTSYIMLNRYVQHSILTPAQLARHNALTTTHAEALLQMMDVVVAARRVPGMSFTSPFVGFCIVTAVDIISRRVRRGVVRARIESFGGARQILDDLAAVWQSARYQQTLVARRVMELEGLLLATAGESADEGQILEVRERIEQICAREMDCVYQ